MINKIIGTVSSRIMIAVLSLIIMLILSRQLGAETVGTISLIVLSLAIIQLVNSFIGGSALVYLVPRFNVFKLYIPSIIWAAATSAITVLILDLLNAFPEEFFKDVFLLSLLQSFAAINFSLLLGKEKVRSYNIITSLQTLLLLAVLLYLIFADHRNNIQSYIIALYISCGFAFLLSQSLIMRFIRSIKLSGMKEVMKNLMRYGTYVQSANLIQLFNYRLNYYLIENILGRASLGIYSIGTQLSEGLWLTGKSLAIVQYARISNSNDKEYAKKITLIFAKISFLTTTVFLGVLLLIPIDLFSWLFGKDFSSLPLVILSLGFGILILSLSFPLAHYFSGLGKHYHNSISSAIGLTFTACLGYYLIPLYGLAGAGITTSIAYSMTVLYQLIMFTKLSGSRLKELLLTPSDIRMFLTEIKNRIKK